MEALENRVAFVTGGASGIGFGMATAFGRHGMKVMLGDIEEVALNDAVVRLRASGVDADGVVIDVAKRADMERAAAATVERFGKVHVLCNNAGVTVNGAIGTITPGDWDWVIDVNLMGVVYGAEAFLPYLRAHGEGGHIVNTASAAGLLAAPSAEPYTGTKYAVLGMSECWAAELAGEGIGVSVLCPGFVQSRINESTRTRGARYGAATAVDDSLDVNAISGFLATGTPADVIGERVVEAIRENTLFILPHTEYEPLLKARFAAILAAFDRAADSPIIPRDLASSVPEAMKNTIPATAGA